MSVLETAIGWLAPPDCVACDAEGFALCPDCATQQIKPFGERCWRCNQLSPRSRTCSSCRSTGSPSHIWVSTTYSSTAQSLVQLYKFGHLRAAVSPISRIMVETFRQYNNQVLDYVVVPLPTATSRMRERGFGHSELLAKKIAQKLHLEYCNGLRRLGQSRQLGSRREDRLKQLASSFAVKHSSKIKSQNILLVDDVLTTGGSLIMATQALRVAGAKRVDALVFAKRL
jgi:ComF family protein